MSITSTVPTSRRGYASNAEIAEYIGVAVNLIDAVKVELAEHLIDEYCGYHERFLQNKITGLATAGGSLTITLDSNQLNMYENGYLTYAEVEIIGGTGAGQRRKITANTKAGVVTVDTAWTTVPDTTSFYQIYQIGLFPRRCCDVVYDSEHTQTYYKTIPEPIRRAVCAQYEYIIGMGDGYFQTDKSNKTSESIGDYSYSGGRSGVNTLIAPKAQTLLTGYVKKYGTIIV